MADGAVFSEACTYEYFELSTDVNTWETTTSRDGTLDESEIEGWAGQSLVPLDDELCRLQHTRLLVCTALEGAIWKVHCPQAVYRTLARLWAWPDFLLEAFGGDNNASLVWALPHEAAPEVRQLGLYSGWNDGRDYCVVFDPKQRITNIFMGSDKRDDSSPSFQVVQELFRCGNTLDLAGVPHFPVLALAEDYRSRLAEWTGYNHNKLWRIREGLDFSPYTHEGFSAQHKQDQTLLQAVEGLTKTSQALAGIVEADMPMLERHIGSIRKLHLLWLQVLDRPLPCALHSVADIIPTRVNLLESLLAGPRCRARCAIAETQDLNQTLYALIASQDNNLNYEVAQASLQMAKEANRVASLARRDSTDMRVIAAATFVFLPGTFVATFSSTSFFDFSPRGGKLASSWLWVYFVATLALTAIAMMLWRWASRSGELETARFLLSLEREPIDVEKTVGTDRGAKVSGIAMHELGMSLSRLRGNTRRARR